MISSDLIGPILFSFTLEIFFVLVKVRTRDQKRQSQVSKMLTHDRDEELSLFLEMRRREKEHRGDSLLTGPCISLSFCIYVNLYNHNHLYISVAMVFKF